MDLRGFSRISLRRYWQLTTGALMPMVQITMLQGRTADQKRKIAKRITDALVDEAGARREGIIVAFNEVSKESYASGGELMIDKK
jgi:4-oxalocrotonate tautomerase